MLIPNGELLTACCVSSTWMLLIIAGAATLPFRGEYVDAVRYSLHGRITAIVIVAVAGLLRIAAETMT